MTDNKLIKKNTYYQPTDSLNANNVQRNTIDFFRLLLRIKQQQLLYPEYELPAESRHFTHAMTV